MEQKALNDTNVNYIADTNRNRQSTEEPTLAGSLTAVCENLGQTLQLLANQVEELNNLQTDNIIDDSDELWDKIQPKLDHYVERLVKDFLENADVDLDISVDCVSLRL